MISASDFYQMGLESKDNKDWGDAVKHFTKAIELDPEHAGAYYNRGAAYYWLDMFDESISDCAKSIDLNPDNIEAYYSKGRVCEKAGRIQEAKEAYDLFLEKASPDKFERHIQVTKERLRNLQE